MLHTYKSQCYVPLYDDPMLTELTGRLRRVTNGRPWVPEIDGLRFLAIAGVVLFHILGEVGSRSGRIIPIEDRYQLLTSLIGNGDRGVRLFFVISGLVLALPFARQYLAGGKPVLLKNYFMRRVTRLEPPYIVSVLLFLVMLVLYTHNQQPHLVQHALATMFYVHSLTFGGFNPINMVSWSLEVEVQFYIVAPLFMLLFRIRDKRIRRLVMLALIVLAIPIQIFATHSSRGVSSILRYVGYFLSGLLAADFFVLDLPMWVESSAWDVVALLCMGFAICAPHDWEPANSMLPLVFGALCLAAMRGLIFRRIVSIPVLAVIGGMCYSMYLMHMTAIAIVFKVSRYLISTRQDFLEIYLIQLLIFIPCILFAGTVFYMLFERPCMDPQWPLKLKQWITNRGKNTEVLIRS
jgi:peptidoglycan/LPS O-acetylase OafA/YrhL